MRGRALIMGKRKDSPAPQLGGVAGSLAGLAERVSAAGMEVVLVRSALQAVLASDPSIRMETRVELEALAARLAAIVAWDGEGS
jgi:hypothetical protein